MRVYFDPRMVVSEGLGFSKSPSKPELAIQAWKEAGLPIELHRVVPATLEQFALAHDPIFARRVLNAELPNGFGNTSTEIAESLPWTTGSLIGATFDAARTGRAVASPTSGFHHAGYAHNGGFCSLNGLVVSTLSVKKAGTAKNPAILDLDQHHGDGTDNILDRLNLEIPHYTFGAHYITQSNAGQWLAELPSIIRSLRADVLIAQLGADPYERDPLSNSQLTKEQLRVRDQIVFETCKELGIGVAWTLAGGYCKPFSDTLDIHTQSMQEAIRVYG